VSVATLFFGLGFMLMAVLLLSLLQQRGAERVSTDLLEGTKEVSSCLADIPQELTDRLFGPEDWAFVRSHASERTKYVFRQQRRSLALAWMEVHRQRAKKLMSFHRATARTSPQLEPLVELSVTFRYLAFVLFWQILAFAIWVHGPMGLRTLTQSMDSLSCELRDTVENLFPEGLDTPEAMSHLSTDR
jgi:hypothetical protein